MVREYQIAYVLRTKFLNLTIVSISVANICDQVQCFT